MCVEAASAIDPEWLPELIELDQCGGNPQAYIDYIHELFLNDFVRFQTYFRGKRVVARKEPMRDGKSGAFWHLISNEDSQQVPETLERHKRIQWPSAIIKHCQDPLVQVWEDKCHKTGKHGRRTRVKLWFREEYLVVLEESRDKVFLITGYTTDYGHTRRRLRKEYEEYKQTEAEWDNSTSTSDSPSTPCR